MLFHWRLAVVATAALGLSCAPRHGPSGGDLPANAYFEGTLVYRVVNEGRTETIPCQIREGSARCAGALRMPPGWTTAYDGRTGRFCGGMMGTPWIAIGPNELMSLLSILPEDERPPPSPPRPTGARYLVAGVACEEVVFYPQDPEDHWRSYCLAPSLRLAGVKNWIPLFRAFGIRAADIGAFADDRAVIASQARSQDGRLEDSVEAIHVERARLDPNRFNHLCDGLVY